MSNNHSRIFPGRLYPGRVFRATTQVDSSAHPRHAPRVSEVPPTASTGLRETPYDTPCLPLSHFNGSISYPLPRKGGYPLQASLRRSGDRPDLSDLGWSSHWEAHAKLSGPLDRPVSSNTSIIEHIYVFTHVNSTILRKCITQEHPHNEALAHLLLPSGNTQISQHYQISFIYWLKHVYSA